METKAEFRQRETAWRAAMVTTAHATRDEDRERVNAWIAAERKAWGYRK